MGKKCTKEVADASVVAEADCLVREVTLGILAGDVPPNAIEKLGGLVGKAACAKLPATISGCKQRFTQLSGRLERSGHVDVALHAALRLSIASLGAALAARPRDSIARDSLVTRKTLQTRILDRLADGPSRPHLLAADLDVAQPAVSRALRKLIERGHVVKSPSPTGEVDVRARWYALCRPRDLGDPPAGQSAMCRQCQELSSQQDMAFQ